MAPERLKTPLRRTSDGWKEVSWDEALEEIATRFRTIQESHGQDAVGVYLGNPNAHSFGNAIMLPRFFKALGTNSRFSSASADQLPHHVASNYMLGAGMLIPVPDIDHTDFMLIIGANPIVSNGSLMTAPGVHKRLKAIQERGGKIVVVDPRKTETAKKADQHLFIQPETVAGVCGIGADTIRQLARDLSEAKSAVCYSRMGASTQSFGGLCQWLNNVLNILTSNFDRRGGAMFPQPAFDLLRGRKGKARAFMAKMARLLR